MTDPRDQQTAERLSSELVTLPGPTLSHKLLEDAEGVAQVGIWSGIAWLAAHPLTATQLTDGHAWKALLVAAGGVALRSAAHKLGDILKTA